MGLSKKDKLELRLMELDAERQELELAKLEAEARSAQIEAEAAELALSEAQLENDFVIRGKKIREVNRKTRIAKITGVVTDRMAEYLREDFRTWEVNDEVDGTNPVPVTILINSPGGYVIPGLDIFDLIMEYRAKGWKISTKCTGMAMSMGGVLLQAGELREMTPRATFMLHEVGSYAEGKTSDIEDQLEYTKALQRHLSGIIAERAKITEDEVNALWKRRDVFLTADQALEKGFIDRIAK